MVQLADLLGESPAIVALREQVRRLLRPEARARRQPPVLIRGETGTGKGLLAQAIHHASARSGGPFVPINCAAIPAALLEAELFGVEAGAFTDARQRRAGLFQTAHRGTLFLDEVGALARDLQAKLLTAIEDRVVRRVGSVRGEAVDVWVLSATSADLEAAMAAEGFRPDLYHRLATISLWLPPLRERGGDVLQLAGEFLARDCGDYGRPLKTLTPDAQAAIAGYPWPGNVRELANVMERAALMTDAPVVDAGDLALQASPERPATDSGDSRAVVSGFTDTLSRFERAQLIAALDVTGWNVVQAAQQLGIPRTTLRHRMAKHRLARAEVTPPAPTERREARAAAVKLPSPPLAALRQERTVTLLQANLECVAPAAMEFLIEKIEGFGGTLVEVGSSGFLAAFGVTPVEDSPSHAARAALAVRNAVALGGQDRASWPPAPARAVIALHTARVLTESAEGPSSPLQVTLPPDDPCRSVLEDLLSGAEQSSICVSPTITPFLERRFTLASLVSAAGLTRRVLLGLEPTGLGLAGRPLSRLVGRHDELGMLRALFERVESGQGQVVGLIGEPGVGKSRLVYEFRERLARPPVAYLEGHCLSSGSTTPYGPLLELLRQVLGTSELDASPVITAKVKQHLQSLGIESETSEPYLLDLLGVKIAREQLDRLTPEVVKLRTFETVRRICLRLSLERSVVLVVEDLHWIDPTSRDFLASLIDSIASTRILLLTTYRPGCEIPGLPRSHVSQLAVSRLLPRHSLAIVRGIATEGRVPDALAEAIVQKGAGNPFLLEELTWDLATRGGASAGIAVPDTIGEVLRARIDRLPAQDRGLLQAAAVIGRNVPFALLHAVSDVKEEDLRRGLGRLQAAEFLYQMGSAPDLEYTFRHALTQDVTYSSLPPEQRCRVHARIVTVIEQRAMGRIEEQIEQLAYHALRGEVWDKALAYSQQAGEKAAARSAHTEAIGHVTTALELLKNRPDARQRIPQELALQTTLGSALMATKGYAAPEVERAYARARALCQQVEETPELLRVLTGLHMFYRQRAELQTSYEVGKQLLTLAQSLRDPQFLLVARQALGTTSYFLGEFVQARAHLEKGVTLCDAGRPRSQAVLYGQDPGVICLATLARTLWALGYPDEALEKLQESLALARQLSHPFSLSFALYFAAVVYQYRREWRATQECAEALMALSTEHGFTQRAAQARILLGWTLVEQGRGAEGIAQLRESVAAYGATGADLGRSSYLALLAEAYGKGGHAEEGLTTLAEALTLVNKHRIGFNEAEIHRLKGELLLRHSAPTGGSGVEAGGPLALAETEPLVLAEVEACFRRALDVARRQQAKSLELRAAVSLSRLWQRQAKSAQARNLLTEIYGWFTQGFDTADLQEANALLEALG